MAFSVTSGDKNQFLTLWTVRADIQALFANYISLLLHSPVLLPNSKAIEALKENFTEIGPMALVFRKSDGNLEYLAKRIFYHYLGVAEFPMDNVDGYTEVRNLCTGVINSRHKFLIYRMFFSYLLKMLI